MTHFVLIHGGCHGAWCWDRVRTPLHEYGHRTTAVDLPCDVPGSTAADYGQTALQAG